MRLNSFHYKLSYHLNNYVYFRRSVYIVGLSAVEGRTLNSQGLESPDDMMVWTFEDFTTALPGSTIMVRRKLAKVAEFLIKGGNLTQQWLGQWSWIKPLQVGRPNNKPPTLTMATLPLQNWPSTLLNPSQVTKSTGKTGKLISKQQSVKPCMHPSWNLPQMKMTPSKPLGCRIL